MSVVHIDFETRSRVKLSSRGTPVYSADASTEILCCSYAVNDESPRIWTRGKDATDFVDTVLSADVVKGWNICFERYIWNNVGKRLGWPELPLARLRCTMAASRYNNLPGKLEDCGERLKIPKQYRKDAEGHKIMLRLSQPSRNGSFCNDPELFERLYTYCCQDTVAERYIDSLLQPMPDTEQQLWVLDRIMNERGCPIDVGYCESAYKLVTEIGENANVEIRRLSEGKITSTGCVAKIKDHVQALGVNIGSLEKDVVSDALKVHSIDPVAKRLLELRQLGAPAAVKKYRSAIDRVSTDGWIRESLIYYGASATGRAAGDGTQLHNLFRKTADAPTTEAIGLGDLELLEMLHKNPMAALQTGVRGMVCAPEGYTLVMSDLAAIEARVVLWLAGARRGVESFRLCDAGKGPEPYAILGAKVFSIPVAQVTRGTIWRDTGKEGTLALGFGLGATTFQTRLEQKYGLSLPFATCEKTVKIWRGENPEVPLLWRTLEQQFKVAAGGAKTAPVNRYISFHNIGGGVVAMRLPTGRHLYYHEAKALRRGISFMTTKGLEETWGGHLCENAVQAIARDVNFGMMLALEAAFHYMVLTVHDSTVQCVPVARADEIAKATHAIMTTVPAWSPGLPLNAETVVGRRMK